MMEILRRWLCSFDRFHRPAIFNWGLTETHSVCAYCEEVIWLGLRCRWTTDRGRA